MKKIKWGVLGIATIARTQVIPAIERSKNSELYAIASSVPKKSSDYKDRCKKIYNSYEALLADPEVEVVYIPLPNHLHCEWTIKALNAGKHVLCEKPLAMTYAECVEMEQAAKKNNRILMEAFMYRHAEKINKVREIIKSGELGSIQYVYSAFGFDINDPQNVRLRKKTGGGALFDLGCYPINFFNFMASLTNTTLESANAFFVTRKDIDGDYVDVRCNAMLNYENGMTCSALSWFDGLPYHTSVIIGSDRGLVIPYTYSDDPVPMTLIKYDYERDPLCQGKEIMFINEDYVVREEIIVPQSDQYCLEVTELSNAILEGRETSFPIEESLQNMKTIEMLYAGMKPNEKSPAKPRF
jgi:xylose dehydrogenase (NAD/NADP)